MNEDGNKRTTDVKLDEPINVYEIGSRGGAFDDLNKISDRINYFGFEPNPDECKKLNLKSKNSKKFLEEKYFQFAIGGNNPRETLYVTKQPGCSSYLEPETETISFYRRQKWFEVVETFKIPTLTLLDFCQSTNSPKPDFLKIDVEGMELEIIQGMGHLLDNVLGMRIEVNYLSHRKQQPKFGKIISILENEGFRIFQFLENHSWRTDSLLGDHFPLRNNIRFSRGQLAHGDVLLFRCPVIASADSKVGHQQLIKLAMLFDAYGFIAHSKEIINCKKLSDFNILFKDAPATNQWFKRSSDKFLYSSITAFVLKKYEFLKTFLKAMLFNK